MEISLRNSIEAVRMTILTAKKGNFQLTFVIDTGSTENIVFDYVYNQLNNAFNPIDGSTKVFGIDGNYVENPHAEAVLLLGDKSILTQFNVVNADQTVINLQNDYGFQLHGILGIPFLVENHCVIDFSNFTITIGEK